VKIHWLGLAIVVGLAGIVVSTGHFGVALFLLPVAAWYASRIIVHGGFGLFHYARHGVKEEWSGRHYEFAGAKLRAEETDDELVFVEKDILGIIGNQGEKTVELFTAKERFLLTSCEEMVLTQAGCERLLTKCPHPEAKKLMLFLQREAFHPHLRRHGKLKDRVGEAASRTTTTVEEKT
jgi:hypothetical protein